jgi:hypothetical protein
MALHQRCALAARRRCVFPPPPPQRAGSCRALTGRPPHPVVCHRASGVSPERTPRAAMKAAARRPARQPLADTAKRSFGRQQASCSICRCARREPSIAVAARSPAAACRRRRRHRFCTRRVRTQCRPAPAWRSQPRIDLRPGLARRRGAGRRRCDGPGDLLQCIAPSAACRRRRRRHIRAARCRSLPCAAICITGTMSRGNQRDTDRARAQKRAEKNGKPSAKDKDGLWVAGCWLAARRHWPCAVHVPNLRRSPAAARLI